MENRIMLNSNFLQKSLVALFFIVLLSSLSCVNGVITYKYLGCYADGTVRDLEGKDLSFSTVSLELCASQCMYSGFPFLGLQFGSRCFCGNTYGMYGPSTACNTTCGTFYCGGYMANDVYYSVDDSLSSSRILQGYSAQMTFTSGRAQCIKANGDLAIIDTATARDSVIAALSSIPNQPAGGILAWIGLYNYPLTNRLEWTNENVRPFSSHQADYGNYWAPGEPSLPNGCVALNASTKLMQTLPCSTALPYICNQLPPQPTGADTTYPTAPPTVKNDISADNKRLALYIVLPIFFFCYGGSCIVYCIYKIYKNCCRSSNPDNKMILEKTVMCPKPNAPVMPLFTQPLGKPKYIHGEGDPSGKFAGGMGFMGVPGKQAAVYPGGAGPSKGFLNPAYMGSNSMEGKMAFGAAAGAGAAAASKDLIDLSNPSGARPPTLEELRSDSRARMLQNAVQESRDRKEKSGLNGANGRNGANGGNGPNGSNGPNGGNGSGNGPNGGGNGGNGPNGPNGANGNPGSAGPGGAAPGAAGASNDGSKAAREGSGMSARSNDSSGSNSSNNESITKILLKKVSKGKL